MPAGPLAARDRANAEHSAKVKRQLQRRPSSRSGAVHWRSLLPGRDAELAALQRAPHPAVVVLGEPGAGKSTLLAAAFPGSPVLRGLRGLDRLPYRPVLDALRQHTARQLERALADPSAACGPTGWIWRA